MVDQGLLALPANRREGLTAFLRSPMRPRQPTRASLCPAGSGTASSTSVNGPSLTSSTLHRRPEAAGRNPCPARAVAPRSAQPGAPPPPARAAS